MPTWSDNTRRLSGAKGRAKFVSSLWQGSKDANAAAVELADCLPHGKIEDDRQS
jgi:hypothetical protein